jgi:5-methylcytosine-specific restriction protein A
LARNPPWVDDELLVVLDLYLEHRRVLEENDPRVVSASALLNRLPLHSQAGTPGFRTPDSVVLRMANYRSYDPSTAAKGMSNAGRRAEQIWQRYANDPTTVRDLAASIRQIADGPAPEREGADVPEPHEDEVLEGRLIYRLHRRREREPALRARKVATIRATGATPTCEVCGLDPGSVFGDGMDQVLEVHHLRPLRLGARATRLSDLAVVCANCHRALHARGLLVPIEQLRKALPDEFRAAVAAIAVGCSIGTCETPPVARRTPPRAADD